MNENRIWDKDLGRYLEWEDIQVYQTRQKAKKDSKTYRIAEIFLYASIILMLYMFIRPIDIQKISTKTIIGYKLCLIAPWAWILGTKGILNSLYKEKK